jgi:hypothetical protein
VDIPEGNRPNGPTGSLKKENGERYRELFK